MLLGLQNRRLVALIGVVVLVSLAASLWLVARDVRFARAEAEREVVALAEAAAAAAQHLEAGELHGYLGNLLSHPAIAGVTVYSAGGARVARSRAAGAVAPWVTRMVPSLRDPVVGCRQIAGRTVCVEGDMSRYRARVAALVVPHAMLIGATALLLVIAALLARGSSSREIRELTRIVRSASEENNYALRAAEEKSRIPELARAVNTLLEQMQQREVILRRRTTETEAANAELEAFSYSVSHDLRSPLAGISGFTEALREEYGERLDETGREYVTWIEDAAHQMNDLVSGLLQMSRVSRAIIERKPVDVSAMAAEIGRVLRQKAPGRQVDFRIEPGMIASADEGLLHAVLENLMSNAFKFTGKVADAAITVGTVLEYGRRAYVVRDNGAGFDSTKAAQMFRPFQRLHTQSEFEGTGVGLSTVKRIVERHGGSIWAEGNAGKGAAFYFTLGESAETPANAAALTEA